MVKKIKNNRSTSSALIKGSTFRVLQTLISIGIGFWMLPFLILHLGSDDYALWILVGSIISTFYLMDLGLNQAVTRYVARYIYAEEFLAANKIINTAIVIYSCLGFLLFTITTGIAFLVVPGLVTDLSNVSTAQTIVIIAGLSLSLEFPSKAFPGIISAYLRYDTIARVRTLGVILNALAVYYFISAGFGVVALAVISLVVNMLTTAFFVIYSYRLFDGLEFHRRHVSKGDLFELFHFSKWTFIVDLTNLLKKKADIWLIATFISGGAITTYYVAARLTEYAGQLAAQALGFGVPVFTKYYAQEQYEKMADSLKFFVKLNIIVATLFISGFLVLGESFIKLWVADEIEHHIAYQCLIILAVGRLLFFISQPFVSLLMTVKRHKYATFLSIFDTSVAILSAVILVPSYGVIGAAFSFALIIGIIRVIALPIMLNKLVGISFGPLIARAFLFVGYASLATYGVNSLISDVTSWRQLIYNAPAVIVSILLGTFLLFSKQEKSLIGNWTTGKLKKFYAK